MNYCDILLRHYCDTYCDTNHVYGCLFTPMDIIIRVGRYTLRKQSIKYYRKYLYSAYLFL